MKQSAQILETQGIITLQSSAQLLDIKSSSNPAQQPVTSDLPEPGLVQEYKPYILNDFADQKEVIDQWRTKFTLESHVTEYLKKLLLQMGLATKILNQIEPITDQQAVKIITLWKCARRPDVNSYFKKLAAKHRLKAGQEQTLSQSRLNVPTFLPPPEINSLPDILDPETEAYYQNFFKHLSILIEPDAKGKEAKYEKSTVCGDDKNFSLIREARNIPLLSCALISISLINTPTSGSVHNAILAFMVNCSNYQIKKIVVNYNSYERGMYQKKREVYKKRIPETKEVLGWYGANFRAAQMIFQQGFKRDLATRPVSTLSSGTHFMMNPKRALELAQKNPDGTRTLIAADVLVGDCCQGYADVILPPFKLGTKNRYENCVDQEEVQVITANEDCQAFPQFSFDVEGPDEVVTLALSGSSSSSSSSSTSSSSSSSGSASSSSSETLGTTYTSITLGM